MAYTATDSISDLDATKPAGSDLPSTLDDAIREHKLVFKAVMANAHSDKGAVKVALFKYETLADVATSANNVWYRLPLTVIDDPAVTTLAGAYTNTIKPKAGIYAVNFFATGYSCARFQCRVSDATGNTLNPSASNALTDLVSGINLATGTNSISQAHGMGLITTDGTHSYGLDFINESAGQVARAPGGSLTNAIAGCVAGIRFQLIGAVAP